MKTNSKKLLIGLGIALLGGFSVKAQSGLEGIIVEKYYQANAADVANAFNLNGSAANPGLSVGSITYRVFVDMATGWKFNSVYGNSNHAWKITTTTAFYNDPQNYAIVGAQGTGTTVARQNTRMIDSYITTGGAATGKAGVLKVQDTDGTIGNAQGILANNPGGVFGAPINGVGASDGLLPGALGLGLNILAPTAVGLSPASDAFDFNAGGSTFSVTNGAMSALGGIVGTNTSNIVFIGQFTTDGVLGFELNVQLQNITTSNVETWVANNPGFGEFTMGALTLAPPTVTITSPTNGANFVTPTTLTITAGASATGSISSVQFFVDGNSVGTDLTAPYTANYTTTNGTHTINAIATDNNSLTANSSDVIITSAANQPPTVSLSGPTNALIGSVVTVTASATDPDGTVASVSFSNGAFAFLATDVAAPYTYSFVVVSGPQTINAKSVDNLGAFSTLGSISVNGVANIPPVVTITAPSNGTTVIAPNTVTITATATDPDGTVTAVTAYVNNVAISTFTTSGPNFTWTYNTSTLSAVDVIKVVATDNAAGSTTSTPVTINVANPNALPYMIRQVTDKCNISNFCLPIAAAATYSISNVIGYDFTLLYDASKVTPTGSVTVIGGAINPNIVTVVNAFGGGTMNVSAYFNGNAQVTDKWTGTGGEDLFCVGFTKNPALTPTGSSTFAISFFQESRITGVAQKLASSAIYQNYKDSLFSASLKFWQNIVNLNGPAIPYSVATPTLYLQSKIYGSSNACAINTPGGFVSPDLNGNFSYDITKGSSIIVQRDIANNNPNMQDVVNAGDQVIGRRLLLNTATGPLTPNIYQVIALDVNLDGVVSAGDLSQMNQRAVNIIGEYQQAWNYNAVGTNTLGQPSNDWTFVDSSRIASNPAYQISNTFPLDNGVGFSKSRVPVTPFCLPVTVSNLTFCPVISHETYRGILLGDADGNWAAVSGTLLVRPNGDKIVIDLEKSIVNGKTVEVPVSFVSSTPVLGLDFSMKLDESNVAFNTMTNYSSNSNPVSFYNPNDKTLRFTTTNADVSAYTPNQSVATIRFETQNGVITEDQLSNLKGWLNGEAVAVEVTNKTVGVSSLGADKAVSIYPNPSTGILNITSISDATVQMFDVTGKEVLLQSSVTASKTQQINLSGLVNGVYTLKVYNNDFITIKKVVLNR